MKKYCIASVLPIIIHVLAIFLFSACQQRPEQSLPDMGEIHSPFNKRDSTIGIILMDGTRLNIDKNQTGLIARQGSIRIEHKATGEIVYTQEDANPKESTIGIFNEVRVPRRKTAWVRLTDGSRVCLNANSSFRFPLYFTPKIRKTSLNGEAYFQITQDDAKPFTVVANGDSIETFGSNFNCESYTERAASEVALERGSIRIITHNKRVTPKPGEMVSISKGGEFRRVRRSIREVTSYKDGYLFFDGTNLPRILEEAECWYGVKIIPKEPIDKSLHYHLGNHPLSGSLSDFLERFLILKDLHFEIQNDQYGK